VLRNVLVLVFSPGPDVTPSYAFNSLTFAGITLDFVRISALGA
jgi:hypothetical protein